MARRCQPLLPAPLRLGQRRAQRAGRRQAAVWAAVAPHADQTPVAPVHHEPVPFLGRPSPLFHHLMHSVGCGVLFLDAQRQSLVCSERAQEIYNLPASSVSPAQVLQCNLIYTPDGVTRLTFEQLPLVRALAGEFVDEQLLVLRQPGKSAVRMVTVTARPVPDSAGGICGAVAFVRDVTREQLAQQHLRNHQQQLRASILKLASLEQSERRQLAKRLHDHLAQLLVVIKIKLGLYSHDSKITHLEQSQQVLDQALEATRELTNELSPPVLYELGLCPALGRLVQQFRMDHGLEIDYECNSGQEGVDERLRMFLYQAARELLLNVVRHSGQQQVWLQVIREGDDLVITVKDEGAGFDSAAVSHGTRQDQIGLFNIRERLGLLGGRMEIESTPRAGTTVRMVVRLVPLAVPQALSDAEPAASTQSLPPVTGEAIRILLIDDHKIIRDGLRGLIEAHPDLQIIAEGGNGAMAVDLARRLTPDVIIMDVAMPQMNGIEATRIISGQNRRVRIIGLSMHTEEEMARSMCQAGACVYLRKDGPSEDLITAIRQHARQGQIVLPPN